MELSELFVRILNINKDKANHLLNYKVLIEINYLLGEVRKWPE